MRNLFDFMRLTENIQISLNRCQTDFLAAGIHFLKDLLRCDMTLYLFHIIQYHITLLGRLSYHVNLQS